MNRLTRSLSTLSIMLAAASPVALGDELYRQDPVSSVGGYSSQDARNPGGLGQMYGMADNFEAPAGWNITALEFWGGYVTVLPGNTHGFAIQFYADNNGHPGALLLGQDVNTFTETVYYTYPPPQNWNGFHYTLTLNTPFAVPGAGRYWLGVQAILDFGGNAPQSLQWGWAQALAVHPPVSEQWIFSPGNFQPQPNNVDMSFVLIGNTGSDVQGVCCQGSTCAASTQTQCPAAPNTQFKPLQPTCNLPGNNQTPCCKANFNQDNVLNVNDIFAFLAAWFANSSYADIGAIGPGQVNNIFLFLGAWFGGCPTP